MAIILVFSSFWVGFLSLSLPLLLFFHFVLYSFVFVRNMQIDLLFACGTYTRITASVVDFINFHLFFFGAYKRLWCSSEFSSVQTLRAQCSVVQMDTLIKGHFSPLPHSNSNNNGNGVSVVTVPITRATRGVHLLSNISSELFFSFLYWFYYY